MVNFITLILVARSWRYYTYRPISKGWLGGANVSCISRHQSVQLILAYSWARPAILVAGKGRGGMFLFLLFLHFQSFSSFFPVPYFHLFYSLLSLFSLSLGDDTKWPTRVDMSLNPNTIKSPISIAWTSLGLWKLVGDMGSSSNWGLIMVPVQEANGDNLGVFWIFCIVMVCWMYSLESPQWGF